MKTRKEESQFVAMGDAGADKRPDEPEEEAYGPESQATSSLIGAIIERTHSLKANPSHYASLLGTCLRPFHADRQGLCEVRFEKPDYDLFSALSQMPTQLRQISEAQPSKTIVIDEPQKIPHLMDEIHWLIESKGYQFIMSGSSARKFRRGKVNLLGGRARKKCPSDASHAWKEQSKQFPPVGKLAD